MAGSETPIPRTLEDAVAELMRDPSHPLRLAVNDVEVEMCLVGGAAMKAGADVLNGAIRHGETAAEVIQLIRDGRDLDDLGVARHL